MRTKNQDEGHLVLTVIIENEAIDTIENAVIAEKGEEGVHHLIDTDITVLTGIATATVIATTTEIESVTTIVIETTTEIEEIDAGNHPAMTVVETAETESATTADSKLIPPHYFFLCFL